MIPLELQRLPRYIVWRYASIRGKFTKLPVHPITGARFEKGKAQNQPENWLSYEDALKALDHLGEGHHLGLYITHDLNLVVIDLDERHENKEEIVSSIDSYTERSPSGKGLHIIASARLSPFRYKLPYEIHNHNGWVSITGDTLEGYENVRERRAGILVFLGDKIPDAATNRPMEGGGPTNNGLPESVGVLLGRDVGLTEKWNSEPSGDSSSELEMSLVNMLVFRRIPVGDIRAAMSYRFPHRSRHWDDKSRAFDVIDKAGRFLAGSNETPGTGAAGDSSTVVGNERPIRLRTIQEMLDAPEPQFLLEGFLQENSMATLFGESGKFKSFLALDWSLCLATGIPWNGYQTPPDGLRVCYAAAEGGPGMGRRIQAWRASKSHLDVPDLYANLAFLTDTVHLTDHTHVERFLSAVEDFAPRLVVLDTLNWFFGDKDENLARDMQAFIAGCGRLQANLNACVLVLTHPPKTGNDKQDARLVERGSSVLAGAAQARFTLKPYRSGDKDNPAHPKAMQLITVKQKDAEEEQPLVLIPHRVFLGFNAEGKPYGSTTLLHKPRWTHELFDAICTTVMGNKGITAKGINEALGMNYLGTDIPLAIEEMCRTFQLLETDNGFIVPRKEVQDNDDEDNPPHPTEDD